MSATLTESTLTGDYQVDPSHSHVGFTARHAMVTKVRGSFSDFEATGHLDVDDPSQSKVTVRIDPASVDTRNDDRDQHLRSGDFFDVEQFPAITFSSTSVERPEEGIYRVTGDLTIKDTTKPVTIDFESTGSAEDPWGNTRVGFEGSTKVDRTDWGLTWNTALDKGGVLVSEKVTLEFEISAVKKG